MNYVIVDLDGTVADSRHRSHHIRLQPGKVLTASDGTEGVVVEIDHDHFPDNTAVLVLWDGADTGHWHTHTEIEQAAGIDWDKWDAGTSDDTPISETISILSALARHRSFSGTRFLFLTARGERARALTTDWLYRHTPFSESAGDLLVMRPAGDTRKDTVVKLEIIRQMKADGANFLYAFDDRGHVARALRDEGIFTFHCASYD